MRTSPLVFMIRLSPVIFVCAAAMLYVLKIEAGVAYPFRNLVPMLTVILLAALALAKGGGRWGGEGWRWMLGAAGFSIPAIGLSLYLHYGYATDLHGMYSESVYPQEVFRYLPLYTMFAGMIGFAIGWIAGRNL